MTANQIESLRHLLYPLGLLPLIAFSTRFLIQWWKSEKQGRTVVPNIFWHFSIVGNTLLALHAFIQLHFPLYFLQIQQTTLAWRNLNLIGKSPYTFRRCIWLILVVAILSTLLYISQKLFLPADAFLWIRAPNTHVKDVSIFLHIIGCAGIAAFSIRFWVQWWEAETAQKSVLLAPFWWLSLAGAVLSGIYFTLLQDWVNVIGPVCSLIPYARNLILSKKMVESSPCDIALVAGETSGDLVGKAIAECFLLKNPRIRLAGIAGKEMRKAGVEAWALTESFQVMGFVEVLKRIFFFYRAINSLTNKLMQTSPRAVLFIDQPSFSLAVAKRLKKRGFPGKIIQVVAPTVWAYKKKRVDAFAATFDAILPLFRFECAYFQNKMATTWVGHPVLEHLQGQILHKAPEKKYLALFPGSRESEIKKNLPLFLEAAAILLQKDPALIPAVVLPDMIKKHIQAQVEEKLRAQFPQAILFPFDERYRLMQQAKGALTKSGTVTLELALLNVPFVCCYQTTVFTLFWLQNFCQLETSTFALPNILSQKKVFPEHILPPVSAKNIAQDLEAYIIGEKSFPVDVKEAILHNINTGDSFGKRVVEAVERACS